MVSSRNLVLALALLFGASSIGAEATAAPHRPRASAVRRKAPARRPAPKRAARVAPSVARPTPLDLGSPDERQNSAPAGATDAERALQRQIDGILSSQWLKSAINGVYVVDAKSGDVLYAYAPDRQLNPASNTKLISTATALEALGPDYTYDTHLYGPEPDASGVIHGDVFLLGSGDPTLRTAHLAEMAAELKERGVKKIEGSVVVSSDDRDGLALPFVRVTVIGGGAEGDLARVRLHPDSGYFTVDNRARTGKARQIRKKGRVQVGTIRLSGDGAQLRITVSGKLRRGQELSFLRGVPRPVFFTGHTLRANLLNAGIEVTGGVKQREKRPEPGESDSELATHQSVPLRQLAAMINKPSNNFLADRLILTVGAEKYGGDRSMDKGVRAMSEWLAKIGVSEGTYRLENGSGLSHLIHVSARQIADVLMAGIKDERIGKNWLESFSVGGVDGTLRSRFAGHPVAGYIRGKTGTLNGVSALSGFVTVSEHDSICFSVLSSGYRAGRKAVIRQSQAQIADAIFDYLRGRVGAEALQPPAGMATAAAPGEPDSEESEGEEQPTTADDSGAVLGNPDVEL